MALETPDSDWLIKFTGESKGRKDFAAKEIQREACLAEVERALGEGDDSLKEQIRAGVRFDMKKKGFFGGKLHSLEEEGEQGDEIETEDASALRAISPADAAKAAAALEKLSKLRERLSTLTLKDADGNSVMRKRPKMDEVTGKPAKDSDGKEILELQETPLFEADDLITELYAPLVRERIVPDNLLPDSYSETQQMITATNKIYTERLIKFTEESEDEPDGELAKKVIKHAGIVATSVAKIVGGEEGILAAEITQVVVLALTTSVTAGYAISKADSKTLVNDVGGAFVDVVGGTLTLAGLDETVVKSAVGGIKAVQQLSVAANAFAQNPPDIEGALTAIGNGFASGMALGAAQTTNEKQAANMTLAGQGVRAALLTGANIKRIKAAIENREFAHIVDHLTAIASDTMQGTLTSMAANSDVGRSAKDKKESAKALTAQIKSMGKTIEIAGTGGKIVVSLALAVHSRNIGKYADDLVDHVGEALGGVVEKVTDKATGAIVMTAFNGAVSIGTIVKALRSPAPDYAAVLGVIGKSCGDAIRLVDPESTDVEKVAGLVQSGILLLARSTSTKKAFDEGRYDDAVKLLSDGIVSVLGKTLNLDLDEAVSDEDVAEEEDEEKKAELVLVQAIQAEVAGANEDAKGVLARFRTTLQSTEGKKKLATNLQEKQVQEMEERQAKLEAENAARLRELTEDEALSPAARDAMSIETLLKQLQKDRALLMMAAKLANGGLKLAEQFCAPLAAASAAVRFVEAVVQAANRMIQLNRWVHNVRDAKSAQSVYSSAAQNFVKNQSEQVSHYTIVAALELTQMIGAIMSSSGMGAIAGEAVNKSAVAAAAIESAVYAVYKEVDLQVSWRATKESLRNPKNRKLALKVRAMNPTLAKYTIAYGAVVQRDAIARNCLAACNLDEIALNHKDSGVEAVQHYLEVYYTDDNVVLKRITLADWVPDPVTVDLKCWGAAKTRGADKGGLLDVPTPVIEGAIVEVVRYRNKLNGALAEHRPVDADPLLAALDGLLDALGTYSPLEARDAKTLHEAMDGFVESFSNAVVAERQATLKADGVRKHKAATPWIPTLVTVKVDTWAGAKAGAIATAGLKDVPTAAIDSSVAEVATLRAKLAVADDAVVKTDMVAYLAALQALLVGLDAYKPRTATNEPHADMIAFKNDLGYAALAELNGANARRKTIPALA